MTPEKMQLIINIQMMCEKSSKVISFGFLEQLDAETLRHIQTALIPEYNVAVAGMKPEEVPLWGEPDCKASFDYAKTEAQVAAFLSPAGGAKLLRPNESGLTYQYGYWGDHPEHPVSDWKYEVANDDTREGYWQWVAGRLEPDDTKGGCPTCGGDSIQYEAPNCDGLHQTQGAVCNDCGAEWQDIYRYSHTIIEKDGEKSNGKEAADRE
jgi:hypothetical protein